MKKFLMPFLAKMMVVAILVLPTFFVSLGFVQTANAANEAIAVGVPTVYGQPNTSIALNELAISGTGNDTIPVRLHVENGTLTMPETTNLTMHTSNTGDTIEFSGARIDVNAAIATLTYTSASVGQDVLEISLSNPGEVVNPDNGHLYAVVNSAGITWNAANSAAQASTRYGSTGYLVSMSNANENTYVANRISNAGWMGATDALTEGDWKWVGGPEAGISFWSGGSGGHVVNSMFANWNSGEPNDSGAGEDCGQFIAGGNGKWNDLPCNATSVDYYVVEYGAPGDLPTIVNATQNIVVATEPAQMSTPTATAGIESAEVSFSAPSNGGAPITGYTVTAQPGGTTATGATSPITVTGLDAGTAYTFSVVATNAIGDSDSSNQSNSVIPTSSPTWDDDLIDMARVDVPYEDSISAIGYPEPEYEITSGTLPVGLTFDEQTGEFSGTPTVPGEYSLTIAASNGVGSDITKTFTLTVANAPAVAITIEFNVGDNISDDLSTLVSGAGLKPDSEYSVVLESTPRTIASGIVGSNGSFSARAYLPRNLEGGSHSITVYGTSVTNRALSDSAYFRVNNSGKILAVSETGAIGNELPITGFDILSLCLAGLLLLSSGYVLLRKTKSHLKVTK